MTGPESDIRDPRSSSDTEKEEGLIQRSMRYLLNNHNDSIKLSYCEIYNEFVYDLLNVETTNLSVHYHERNGFFVFYCLKQ